MISEEAEEKNKLIQILKMDLQDELGGILNSLIPELEIFIGKRLQPQPLSTVKDTQDRIFKSFITFLNCFTNENFLVIVIDDLQWADSASFQFIERLLLTPNENIFMIGAYRDNEVDSKHPLVGVIKESKSISEIKLAPLDIDNLNKMVSETLDCSVEESMKLSELIYKKTAGNPFFSREFLNTLYQEELVYFENGKWNWEIEKVEKMNFSSNVIDFMTQNLKKFPKNMQKLLNRASCVGNSFSIEELKWIWDEDSNVENELIEPLKEGWLYQVGSNEYRFFHDRLQQSAYELFDPKEMTSIHLVIGNVLLKKFKNQNELELNIFKVINHLNKSKEEFEDKNELIQLNLIAAQKSIQNSANDAALQFSTIAIDLLGKNSWEDNYDLSLESHLVLAEAYYSNILFEKSEEIYTIVLEKAKGRRDVFIAHTKYMKMASVTYQYDKAYHLLIKVFKLFDLTKDIPFDDVGATLNFTFAMKAKVDEQVKLINGMKNIKLLKKCNDPELVVFFTSIFESFDIMFLASTANPLLVVTMSLVCLYGYFTEGIMDSSALGFAYAGWVYGFFFKDPDCEILTTIAEELLVKDHNPMYNFVAARFLIGFGKLFGGNLKQFCNHLISGYKYSLVHSEHLFGAYCTLHETLIMSLNGENFLVLIQKCENRKDHFKSVNNFMSRDCFELMDHFGKDLAGISTYNPEFLVPNFTNLKTLDSFSRMFEAVLNVFKGDFDKALSIFTEMIPMIGNTLGISPYYETKFYHAITLLHFYKQNKNEEQKNLIQTILNELETYAKISPEYLEPKYQLLTTILAGIEGTIDIFSLLSKYESIVVSGNKFGLSILSAFAYEFLLELSVENNLPKGICTMYFENCFKIWNDLSAKAKCNQLQGKYNAFVPLRTKRINSNSTSLTSVSQASTTMSDSQLDFNQYSGDSLDMMSIIKSSQALSGELTLSNLITTVMNIIIENTGAELGMLFLSKNGGATDYLESTIKHGKIKQIHKLTTEFKENEKYCSFLMALSKTIKKTITLNNVGTSEYSDNEYLKREGIKSLCIFPIFKGKKYIGTIYLENKSLEGIFDENRKEILQHISSQLAISFENAKLYDDMNSLNSSYERFLPKEFLKQLGKGDVRNIKKGDASTKEMAVLFSDIRSFTDLTEKMNPSESFSFVNEILSYLAPIISKNNGFIDKFFGDCIMALFPYNVDDSINCGFEMLSALEIYNKECRKDVQDVQIGIGIHYGNVMLGTIGAEDRIDATVISDTVNTASRVESLTKALGATFVVTENVLQNCKSIHKNRYIGKYLLKGKEIPMSLFQMLEDKNEENIEEFTNGIQFFESGKFEESEKIFSNLNDKTSNYLEKVVKFYKKYSFNESWSGEIKIDKDGNLVDLENDLKINKTIQKLSKEEKLKIMNQILENGDFDAFMKSMSFQNPEIVEKHLKDFSK